MVLTWQPVPPNTSTVQASMSDMSSGRGGAISSPTLDQVLLQIQAVRRDVSSWWKDLETRDMWSRSSGLRWLSIWQTFVGRTHWVTHQRHTDHRTYLVDDIEWQSRQRVGWDYHWKELPYTTLRIYARLSLSVRDGCKERVLTKSQDDTSGYY